MLSLSLLLACTTDEVIALDAPAAEKLLLEGPSNASPAEPPARIVAVGDVHGDPPALLHVLSLAGLVDATGAWIGGPATLVQTGDITDRGADSRGVIATLRRLQAEAAAAGGQVVPLLGNHEVMNMQGDLRYVNPEDTVGYGGEAARAAAFSVSGDDGTWLRGNDAVAMIDGTVFCHGGVTPRWAAAGVLRLNQMVRAAIDEPAPGPGEPRIGLADVLGPDGPLWYRGYLLEEEPVACKELAHALEVLGAERLVVGHTTQESGEVAVRCGGKLYGIDTGISAHYGNHYAAIEIKGDAVQVLPTAPAENR